MSGRNRIVCLVLIVSLVAGCGRFGREEDVAATSSTTSPPSAATSTSETSAPTTSTPDVADQPDAADPAPAPAPASAGRTDAPANVAAATEDGLRVTVVADGAVSHPRTATFRIGVSLTNESDRTRHYLLGQGRYALLVDAAGGIAWTSTDCNPTLGVYEIEGGAYPLQPGETIDVVVEYPGAEECRLPAGSYTLFGQFPICPEEHLSETANPGTYRCAEGAEQLVRSAGLAITLTP